MNATALQPIHLSRLSSKDISFHHIDPTTRPSYSTHQGRRKTSNCVNSGTKLWSKRPDLPWGHGEPDMEAGGCQSGIDCDILWINFNQLAPRYNCSKRNISQSDQVERERPAFFLSICWVGGQVHFEISPLAEKFQSQFDPGHERSRPSNCPSSERLWKPCTLHNSPLLDLYKICNQSINQKCIWIVHVKQALSTSSNKYFIIWNRYFQPHTCKNWFCSAVC